MVLFFECQKLRRLGIIFSLIALTLLFSKKSVALTTATLPEGVYSPSFRYGHIEGLDQRYTDSGTLVKLTDYKSIEFDAKTISKFNSQAQALITSLNRFGAFNMGDSLNLGTLEINTKPEINYSAPILAKGLSKNWTMALGLPIIHYKNEVHLSQSFSNINYYRSQFSGLSTDLDQALNTNLGESVQQNLEAKGYKRLDNRDQQFIGDAQIVSILKLYEDDDQSIIHQATLSLPTGPQYDSDDLLALNSFHKTFLENSFGYSRRIGNFWKVIPYSSAKFYMPQQITARVPTSEDDVLPDQNSKESLQLQEGASIELGLQNIFDLLDSLQFSFDYKLGTKSEDKYTGANSTSRYDLLSKNSASRWQKISTEIVYSTVKSYAQHTSKIPFLVSLNFFDTIAGNNIERRIGQELSLTLFF